MEVFFYTKKTVNPNFETFPVLSALQKIVDSIQKNPVTILDAPPGSGKTTALPLELLKFNLTAGKKICILEPRRIAAKNAAKRISQTIGESVGGTVGYRVRFDSKINRDTKIEFVTDGILTKYLLSDPELSEYGLLIFDEFHERRLESDICFALARKSQEIFRSDLKILIMSATLEGQNFLNLGITNPPIEVSTVTHPLEIFYMGQSQKNIIQRFIDLIPKAVEQTTGDILVFLSGKKEILDLKSQLEVNQTIKENSIVLPLFGDMNLSDQEKIFLPDSRGRKKIILSTNIAESSVTIPGVRVVFDSGYFKHTIFDPDSGITHLVRDRISLSSAKQRAGRASREGKGFVYKLWSKEEESDFFDRTKPEILEGDLDRLVLEIKSFGEEINSLPFLDPPNKGSLALSMARLKLLGCLDKKNQLTDLGKETLLYPLPIRLGCVISRLPKEKETIIADIVSILGKESTGTETKEFPNSISQNSFSQELKLVYEQILSIFKGKNVYPQNNKSDHRDFYFCKGFPDRIGKRKEKEGKEYKLSNGKIGTFNSNLLHLPEYILALDTLSFGSTLYVTQYLPISIEQIEESLNEHIETVQSPEMKTNQRDESFLIVKEERKIGDLILDSKELTKSNPTSIQNALLEYLSSLDWDYEWKKREDLLYYYHRVQFLVKNGVLGVNVSLDHLKSTVKEWLFPFLNFETQKFSLTNLPFLEAFKSYVGFENQSIIQKEAPTSIQVPSGSTLPLQYHNNEPELHVKLQELFGLKSLPNLANGKVKILVHLLSPARRPVQITKDLESFWNNGYHEVKKELKGRYPKHPWPDKPWEAIPTKHLNHNKRS
nr:ATP-dependent helicase HrpB [Leptospira levettii]